MLYLRHRGEVRGPLEVEKLRSLAAAGVLKPFHEVAVNASGPWARADQILPELPFTSRAANGPDAVPVAAGDASPSPALHDVFVSHSSKDKLTADAVCSALESRGIRCWVAPRDIPPGANWGEAIIDGLSHSRVVILILSQHSNISPQVMREVERAVSKGIPVLPVRIEEVPLSKSLEYFLSTAHWLDAFTPPLRKHLDALVERVGVMITTEAALATRPGPAVLPYGGRRRRAGTAVLLAGSMVALLAAGVAIWSTTQRPVAVAPAGHAPTNQPSPPVANGVPGEPSWLGITFMTLPASVAEHLGAGAGAVGVADVQAGGPAELAGVQRDDVLVSFDGQPVADVKAFEALKIAELPAGGMHALEVLRATRPISLSVTLQPRPPSADKGEVHDRKMFETRHVSGEGRVMQLQLEGDFLAWRGIDGDPNLVICNIASGGDDETVPAAYGRRVRASAFLPGGRQIVLAGSDGELTLCDTATGEVVRHFETTPGTSFRGCQVSPQADVVATVSDADGETVLETWDIAIGKRRSTWNLSEIADRSGFGSGLRISGSFMELGPFSPSGRYVSTADGEVVIWDVTTGKPAWRWKPDKRMTSWAFSPSWRACAVGNASGLIEIVAVGTNTVEQRLRGHSGDDGIFDGPQCLAWHGESLLGSASNGDRTVRIWRIPDGRQIWEYRIAESPNNTFFFGPEAVVFDPGRPRLWTGVTRLREFEIPTCDAASWVVPRPDDEGLDISALAVVAPRPEKAVVSAASSGITVQMSATATFGDGRKRESITFSDGSEATLEFLPGRSRPSAALFAADGSQFTGYTGLALGIVEGKVRVADVDIDGPASQVGILVGDAVIGIAEAAAAEFTPLPTEGTSGAEATRLRLMAGSVGSKARLQIERADTASPQGRRVEVVELTRSDRSPELTIREKRFVTGLNRSVEFSDGSRLEVVARSGGNEEQHIVIGQDGKWLAANLGMTCMPDDSGVVVNMIAQGGPAAKAGVCQGDHVIGVAAGEGDRFAPCTWSEAESARWLWSRISHGTPGSKARLRLRRAAGAPTVDPEIVTITRAVPGSTGPRPKAAKVDWTNGLGMPFILVKPGTFFMGVSGWLARDDAPVHYVRISQPFLISAFEVTQAEYATVDPEHVSAFSVMGTERLRVFGAYRDGQLPLLDTSNLPVDSVTWDEATAFCDTLSKRERVSYRLLTEAEWEYACRDAGAVRWDKNVNLDLAINQRAVCQVSEVPLFPAVVGSRSPNDLGIYDMLGNVGEWCSDVYDPVYLRSAARVDPAGPAEGFKRVVRGGGYDSQFPALFQRAGFATNEKRASLGFRVVIPLAGDVGADETLKKLAAASAPKPVDLSTIPNPLPIAALPIRSADEEQEALAAFSREIIALEPAEIVARIRKELPTFQRRLDSERGLLGRYVPSAQRAIDVYFQAKRAADEDTTIRLLMDSLEADTFLGWPANDVAWSLATAMPEARRDADAAVEYAIAACQASGWRYWGHLDTLAAALAAAGKQQLAVRIVEAALPQVPEGKREECQRLLDRYRAGDAHAPAVDPLPTP